MVTDIHCAKFIVFLFLLIRSPPTSTLFPYTTLFRSYGFNRLTGTQKFFLGLDQWDGKTFARSEEHTSELQSHSDLVCRLLLEKKNSKCTHSFRENEGT